MSSYLKQIHLADWTDDQSPHKYVKDAIGWDCGIKWARSDLRTLPPQPGGEWKTQLGKTAL